MSYRDRKIGSEQLVRRTLSRADVVELIPPLGSTTTAQPKNQSRRSAAGYQPTMRVKVGRNWRSGHTCSHCQHRFLDGGMSLRLLLAGKVVDLSLCEICFTRGWLYEAVISFEQPHNTFPLSPA